jgi:hypothetical protein
MNVCGLIFFVWGGLCVSVCVRAHSRAFMYVVTFEMIEFHATFHIFGHSETHSTNNVNIAATHMYGMETTLVTPDVLYKIKCLKIYASCLKRYIFVSRV